MLELLNTGGSVMHVSKTNPRKMANSSPKAKAPAFTGPLALGLMQRLPFASDPLEAIYWHAQMLVVESGMSEPPFSPINYAPLRMIDRVSYADMAVDGRLLPRGNRFV